MSVFGVVYRGLRPIVLTMALAVGPLIVASTATVFLARTFEDLRSIGYWVIMLPVLLAARWKQALWTVGVMRGTVISRWKRVRVVIFQSVTSLAYVISAFRGDVRLSRKAWVSFEAIHRFLLAEILALLILIPLTWWAIVKTQWDRAAESSRV